MKMTKTTAVFQYDCHPEIQREIWKTYILTGEHDHFQAPIHTLTTYTVRCCSNVVSF